MKANTFGIFLYQKRKELGMTKQELASIIGVVSRTISNWENDYSDGRPGLLNLLRLSEVLNIPIDDMLF